MSTINNILKDINNEVENANKGAFGDEDKMLANAYEYLGKMLKQFKHLGAELALRKVLVHVQAEEDIPYTNKWVIKMMVDHYAKNFI